ncbi:MAG: type II toxin-antitoxin system HicA family toxin, partial [Pseudonocardiaceae bacterium]
MKVSALLRLIESDGWQLARTRGSHRQYKHPTRPGLVAVAGKPSDDLHPKTLGSILKQVGLRNDTGRTSEATEGGTTTGDRWKISRSSAPRSCAPHWRRLPPWLVGCCMCEV